MTISEQRWHNIVLYLQKNVKGFEIIELDIIKEFWFAAYPKVLKPKSDVYSYKTLHHEGIHLLDAQTFFNLLPIKLKLFNILLFFITISFPQNLFLLSLLGFVNPWFFLFALFVLPFPSPGRAWMELRAYRRSVEIGMDIDIIVKYFKSHSYYYMLPFPKLVKKLLQKPSPYKEEMDKLL